MRSAHVLNTENNVIADQSAFTIDDFHVRFLILLEVLSVSNTEASVQVFVGQSRDISIDNEFSYILMPGYGAKQIPREKR